MLKRYRSSCLYFFDRFQSFLVGLGILDRSELWAISAIFTESARGLRITLEI